VPSNCSASRTPRTSPVPAWSISVVTGRVAVPRVPVVNVVYVCVFVIFQT
jgi:hypothetical protein